MKKLLAAFLIVIVMAAPSFAADTKISAMTADTTPTSDDLIPTIDAPGSSPANKSVTLGNAITKAHGLGNWKFGYTDGSGVLTGVTVGASGTFPLFQGTTSAPIVSTLILPNSGTAYKLLAFSATNTVSELAAVGATGQILQGNTGAIPSWSAFTLAAPGDAGGMLLSDGTNWTRVTTLTGLTFGGFSTTAGTAVISDGSGYLSQTFTNLLPDAADGAALGSSAAEWSDLYLADGGVIYFQNDQSVYLTPSAGTLTLTGALVTSGAVTPSAANGAALGSATAEWADLFLHDGAVIYGQADQSATLTSSASLWTANNFAITGYLAIGSDPADAGSIRLPNAGYIYSEADAAGTDISLIGADSSEVIQIGASGASGVTITPALTASGGIKVLTPVIDDADNFDDNFTGSNLYGGTFIVNAAGTIVLPDPAVGMSFTIVLEGAVATIIDPLGTGTADTIVMHGLAAAADENITSSTVGAMCVFQYRAANSWMATCKSFTEATPP